MFIKEHYPADIYENFILGQEEGLNLLLPAPLQSA